MRAAARAAAEAALGAAGFSRGTDDRWNGTLPGGPPAGGLPAGVRLPPDFPDALPEVFVDRVGLVRRVAHVERSGKVCLAPSSGVLLDAERPAALVEEALARAARTVGDGLLGRTDADLRQEFTAYWWTGANGGLSICSPVGPARVLARARVGPFGRIAAGTLLVADDFAGAERWARALGTTASHAGAAFLVPVATPFDPPDFGQALTVRQARDLVDAHASAEDAVAFRAWLAGAPLPATVVLSLPEASPDGGRALVAMRLPAPTGDAAKRAAAGFRAGQVRTERQLGFAALQPVERVTPVRLDGGFLRARGGATVVLGQRAVTLVGAGAIGSEVAGHLAALGVGLVRVVDHDDIEAANVHRHALGVSSLKLPKAAALCTELARRFPHLRFEPVVARAEDALAADPDVFLRADLVVFATGEETLERRLTALLAGGPPRVHAWVEPLGLAGHALACGPVGSAADCGGTGCYECLFEVRDELGPVNRSALTAPGQEIRRSLAGCAGTFSPFSALDARRSALEAAELAGRVLRGALDGPVLVTWRGDRSEFEEAGLRLSARARVVPVGGRVWTPGAAFARADCPVCGRAAGEPRP